MVDVFLVDGLVGFAGKVGLPGSGLVFFLVWSTRCYCQAAKSSTAPCHNPGTQPPGAESTLPRELDWDEPATPNAPCRYFCK